MESALTIKNMTRRCEDGLEEVQVDSGSDPGETRQPHPEVAAWEWVRGWEGGNSGGGTARTYRLVGRSWGRLGD